VLLVSLFLLTHSASAKRAAPKAVPPVVYHGATYSVPNDNGKVGYILASYSDGKGLFQIKIFETDIDPKLEEDVQWVFITGTETHGQLVGNQGREVPLLLR